MKRTIVALALVLVGCSTRSPSRVVPSDPRRSDPAARAIRVALDFRGPRIGATRELHWYDGDGRNLLARGRGGGGGGGEQWIVERENPGARVRAVRPNGVSTDWQRALVARVSVDAEGFITVSGKRYRGEILVLPVDTTFVIINRLDVEDYLRGVVPLEMGGRPRGDSAALQAQAVASRSYAYVRTDNTNGGGRAFDVRASTLDQVYGGVDVENDAASAAVDATRGLVLRQGGRTADALYHSTCGGSTAEAAEVWRTPGASHLRRVSDRIPGRNRYYCDIAPQYRWTRRLGRTELNAALEQYLKLYASVPGGRPGAARIVAVGSRTPSGRVGVLEIETDRGIFTVRGNDIRYVLRSPGGAILSSTYFSVEPEYGRDGLIARVTLRGQGNGHGVGMCQWGAIGRARAGHSFRSILATYYPGTTIGPVSSPAE